MATPDSTKSLSPELGDRATSIGEEGTKWGAAWLPEASLLQASTVSDWEALSGWKIRNPWGEGLALLL